jgi:hypothetical protein
VIQKGLFAYNGLFIFQTVLKMEAGSPAEMSLISYLTVGPRTSEISFLDVEITEFERTYLE